MVGLLRALALNCGVWGRIGPNVSFYSSVSGRVRQKARKACHSSRAAQPAQSIRFFSRWRSAEGDKK